MIHIVYVKLETFSVAMLKAVSETSRIKAQTAIILSNSVFQPRIKKNRGNSYFSKTWKDVLWPLYFLKSRIRKEHVFCQRGVLKKYVRVSSQKKPDIHA